MATKKTAARKAPASSKTASSKTASSKTASSKTASSKKAASKKAPAKTASSKKTASTKTASTKTASTKTASTKAPAKNTASSKTASSKTASSKKTSAKKLELKTWNGSCHCGKVRFTVESDLSGAITCNCSICQRAGYVLTFVGTDKFTLLSGETAQTDYQFNKKHIHHLFCSTCGVRAYGWGNGPDGNKMYSVNVRCLEGVDLAAVPTTAWDGASS